MALHSVCTRKLSSHLHSHFTPDTSGCAYGVGSVPIPVCPETSACYSGPSMPCRRSPSSGRRKPTISALFPTHRGRCHCHSVLRLPFHISSATLAPTPSPDMRCADALTTLRQSANHFTHSESAYGLGQGQVGLLSAVQAPQQKACRSVPPRHLPFALILCRHSEFPPFLWLTHFRYAPHRHHRTSPSFIPSTCLYLRQGRTVLSRRSISTLRKLTFTAAILPRIGVAPWGLLHIPRGREGAREKRASARWGVCKAPTGASPRNPQLPHSSVVPSRNPLQIARFCRTGPARDGKFACKSNF